MWFGKKDAPPTNPQAGGAPPWENIDNVPKRHSFMPARFDVVAYTMQVTGFRRWTSALLLLLLAAGVGFMAYIVYTSSAQKPPLPPQVDRPAMDARATSTVNISTTTAP